MNPSLDHGSPVAVSSLDPEAQWVRISRDTSFQQLLDAGDQDAALFFDQATRRLVEWREQQQAKELAEATKAHEEWMKNPDAPRVDNSPKAQLAKLIDDRTWRDKYEAGDLEARRQFQEATEAVAKQTTTVTVNG